MNKIKALVACAAASVCGSLTALAEGSMTVDVSAAGNAADAIGTAISGLITGKIMSNVLLVIGAALAVWGIFLVVKWIRRGAK